MNTNYDIIVTDNNGQELFTLTESNHELQGIIPNEKESALLKTNISHLISNIPNITKNIQNITTYTAYFPKDAAQRLKDGTAIIMKTKEGELLSNAIDTKNKKIIRQARFKSGQTPTNVALVCWQIAAFVTAQKYLADIDKKLEAISKNVEDIKRFQQQYFYAEIETELNYIQSIINGFCSNPNFIQEFERLHMNDFIRTYKSISKNIIILHNELQTNINEFEKINFDKSKIDESIQNLNDKRTPLIKMINLLIGLTESQNILSQIYKMFNENSSFTNNWDNEFYKNKEICECFINQLNDTFMEKNNKLDEKWAWYEIIAPITPIVVTPSIFKTLIRRNINLTHKMHKQLPNYNDSISKNIFINIDKIDELKRKNYEKIMNDMKQMRSNLLSMIEIYQPTSKKIAFDIDQQGKISNIKYIEP